MYKHTRYCGSGVFQLSLKGHIIQAEAFLLPPVGLHPMLKNKETTLAKLQTKNMNSDFFDDCETVTRNFLLGYDNNAAR